MLITFCIKGVEKRIINLFIHLYSWGLQSMVEDSSPDSKVHGADMGPTWVLRPQMGPMLAPWTLIWGIAHSTSDYSKTYSVVSLYVLNSVQIFNFTHILPERARYGVSFVSSNWLMFCNLHQSQHCCMQYHVVLDLIIAIFDFGSRWQHLTTQSDGSANFFLWVGDKSQINLWQCGQVSVIVSQNTGNSTICSRAC